MTTGPTALLAQFAAGLEYRDIPLPTLEVARLVLVDALGAAVAATSVMAEDCGRLVLAAENMGGGRSSVVDGPAARCAECAAFVNGGFFHALNMDALGPGMSHLGVCLPGALALAEEADTDMERLITAVVVGMETATRLALASEDPAGEHGWLSGQLVSYFSATAAAARVAGLDPPAAHSALGIAQMQAAGTMEVMQNGDRPVKAFYGSFPNLAAVISVRMGAAGIDARTRAIEGSLGLLPHYYGVDHTRALTEDLGAHFVSQDALFKRWPVSGFIHPYLLLAADLVESKCEAVRLKISSELRPYSEPLDSRLLPGSAAEAGNSLPYCVARVVTAGGLALDHFTAGGLDNWRREFNGATSPAVDVRQVETGEQAGIEAYVDGSWVDMPLRYPEYGLAQGPAAHEMVETKFRETMTWCGFEEERIDRILDIALAGGASSKATELGRALTTTGKQSHGT